MISPAAMEFALEAHLEEFLVGNWSAVNWGRPLRLWRGGDGGNGQYAGRDEDGAAHPGHL